MRRSAPALLLLLALAGCGTSAPTIDVDSPVGTSGNATASAGDIAIRDATIAGDAPAAGVPAYVPGEDAPLSLVVVNTGDALDRLVSVSAPVAEEVDIAGDRSLPGSAALAVGPSGATAASGALTTVRGTITLADLREPVRAGLTYPVTFTFERAGAVTVELPVMDPEDPADSDESPGASG